MAALPFAIAAMCAAFMLTSCGSGPTQLGGTSGDSSTVINNNNVTSGQNGNGSTLSLDVAVSLPVDYMDPVTGVVTPLASLMWMVTVTDSLKDVLPNTQYTITATFPNGSKDTSGRITGRSWSFHPSLIGSYRIDASDSSGRTAYLMKARDN
jgi:hypothetical protein